MEDVKGIDIYLQKNNEQENNYYLQKIILLFDAIRLMENFYIRDKEKYY